MSSTKVATVFISLLFFSISLCEKAWEPHENSIANALPQACIQIIEKLFLARYPTLNLINAANDSFTSSDVITDMLRASKGGIRVRLDTLSNFKAIKIKNPKKYSVILLDNIESFRTLNRHIIPDIFQFQGFFLFVLTNGKIAEIEEIFATLWSKNIHNVDVVFEAGDLVEVLTFVPFGGDSCGDTKPKLITTFVNGSFTHNIESIYPDKFMDLAACMLEISTFDLPLATIRKSNGNGSFELSGFDMDLLHELSKALNFTTDVKFMTGPSPYGRVNPDGSVSGSLGEVASGRAKIAFGIYLNLYRVAVAEASVMYYSFPEIFAVSPNARLSPFEKLLQPFDDTVWILIWMMILIAFVVIVAFKTRFKRYESFVFGPVKYPFLNMFSIIYGGSHKKLPKRNFARFILMKFLLFCLVMRNAYQGSLYNFLQSDKTDKELETINEMIEQDYELFTYPYQLALFENGTKKEAR